MEEKKTGEKVLDTGWQGFDLGHQQGYTMIPGKVRDKMPLVKWKKYQTMKPTEGEIASWKKQFRHINPLMLTGALSGIVVLDQDGEVGEQTLSRYGQLPETVTVVSPRGKAHRHYWFAYDMALGPIRNFTKGYHTGDLPDLDLRGDGGYAVFPGATHRNGGLYRFIEGCTPWEIEVAALPAWLYNYIAEANEERAYKVTAISSIEDRAGVSRLPYTYGDKEIGKGDMLLTSKRYKAYAEGVLRNQTRNVASAATGERNITLFIAAASISPYVTHGLLPLDRVEFELEAAADSCGLSRDDDGIVKVRSTIRSGIERGRNDPIRLLSEQSGSGQPRTPMDYLNSAKRGGAKKKGWLNSLANRIAETNQR